jgi:general secretion pathway protein G
MDDLSMGTPETKTWPVRLGRGRAVPGGGGSRPGITILEVLLGLAILSTLLVTGASVYLEARNKAMIVRSIGDISVLQKEILIYSFDRDGGLPGTLNDLGRGLLRDPWGNAYEYLDVSTVKGKGKVRKDRFMVPLNTDFDLYSMGKDGQSTSPITAKQSRDDVIRANNGGFIGLASDF